MTHLRNLLVILGFGLSLAAQERTGQINGVVTDPSNTALPNARIVITNKETNRTITVKSGNDGTYTTNLDPGRRQKYYQ